MKGENRMLKTATQELIDVLVQKGGMEVDAVLISSLQKGTILIITTESGNKYLFEIEDAEHCLAHIVRYKCFLASHMGYRGLRQVSSEFSIGSQIVHIDVGRDRYARTSPVTKIVILFPVRNGS